MGQGLARVMHVLQANPSSLSLSSKAVGGDADLQMQQCREKQHLPPLPPHSVLQYLFECCPP